VSKPHSERLRDIMHRCAPLLSADDERDLLQAAQAISRLEQGEGFSIAPVLGKELRPRVDVCWMGMLAQLDPAQARSIGLGFIESASDAESQAAVARYFEFCGVEPEKVGAAVAEVRSISEQLKRPQPVKALVQEPSFHQIQALGRKPS
jgi:hypothetical protein